MIYFLWTLLNFGLLVVFIGICFRATKFIKEKLGLVASVIFVFGLLSFVINSGNKDDVVKKGNSREKDFIFKSMTEIEPNTLTYSDNILEKNFLSDINLGVAFGQEKSTKNKVAVDGNSSISGLVGGHKWEPLSLIVNKHPLSNKWTYEVTGSLKWKLLGTTIYSQFKTFSGSINDINNEAH